MLLIVGDSLGERLKLLREARGWTQGQLAEYAGVTRSWLSNVESGEIDNPRADLLLRVARRLGVTIEFLITGDPPGGEDSRLHVQIGEFRSLPNQVREWVLRIARTTGELPMRVLYQEPPHDVDEDSKDQQDKKDGPCS